MQFCKRLWQVVLLSAVLLPCFTILSPSSPGLATSFQGVSFLAYVPYVGPAFRLARQAVTGPHPWQLFKPFPSHAGLPTEGAEPYAGTNTTSYALPADVRNWSCLDVQHWLQRQNWNWRELNRYAEATCKVGVSGKTLYHLEEDVLEFDFEIRYRLHRRVILEAIRSLQQEQPNGIHYPRDLREYRKEFPTKASVYFSGILSAPRTCLLWLHVFDGDLLKRVRHGANFSGGLADTVAAPAPLPGSTADGRPGPPASLHWLDTNWFFLVSWWLWPGLLVAWHAMRFFHLHPFVVSYVVAVGLARTATEMYSLYMALVHTGINPGEVFSSLVCSHMLTPLINLVLAGCTVATAPLAPLLPQWIIFLIFWGRCVLLPLLTLWADFASWMPNGAELGGNPTRRRPRRGEEGLVHWPPPLEVPEELEEAGDVPDSFRCPITLCIMREPAQTPAGLTYERTAIARWLHAHHSDPSTKMPLRRRHLAPNLSMRCVIDSWVKEASKSRGLKLSNTDPPAAPEVGKSGLCLPASLPGSPVTPTGLSNSPAASMHQPVQTNVADGCTSKSASSSSLTGGLPPAPGSPARASPSRPPGGPHWSPLRTGTQGSSSSAPGSPRSLTAAQQLQLDLNSAFARAVADGLPVGRARQLSLVEVEQVVASVAASAQRGSLDSMRDSITTQLARVATAPAAPGGSSEHVAHQRIPASNAGDPETGSPVAGARRNSSISGSFPGTLTSELVRRTLRWQAGRQSVDVGPASSGCQPHQFEGAVSRLAAAHGAGCGIAPSADSGLAALGNAQELCPDGSSPATRQIEQSCSNLASPTHQAPEQTNDGWTVASKRQRKSRQYMRPSPPASPSRPTPTSPAVKQRQAPAAVQGGAFALLARTSQ